MAEEVTADWRPAEGDLQRWADQLPRSIYADTGPVAGVLIQRARGVVPVVSGDLRASLGTEQTEQGLNVIADVAYAGWVEFGGSRGRAYVEEGRYVYPAVVAAEGQLESVLDQATQSSIDRFGWSNP